MLTTLPRRYAERAQRILTYDCAGLIDQVVWAELDDPDVATECGCGTHGGAVKAGR